MYFTPFVQYLDQTLFPWQLAHRVLKSINRMSQQECDRGVDSVQTSVLHLISVCQATLTNNELRKTTARTIMASIDWLPE